MCISYGRESADERRRVGVAGKGLLGSMICRALDGVNFLAKVFLGRIAIRQWFENGRVIKGVTDKSSLTLFTLDVEAEGPSPNHMT